MTPSKKKKFLRSRNSQKKRFFLFVFLGLFVLSLGVITAVTIYLIIVIKTLPSPNQFGSRQINESTKLYDRTGKTLLYEIHGEEKRTIISFNEVPDYLKWATLAAEDADFYKEPAFNWRGIVRAFLINLREGRVTQGGSTITQQLAKNVFLTSERTLGRKLKELILAIELESRFTKDQVFEFYLNQIPYGSNAYGVEAAGFSLFGKSARDLSLEESAALAGLAKAPSYFSPWGSHVKELLERKDYVINRMVELGYVSQKDGEKAKKNVIKFSAPSIGNIKAPHFSLAVKEYLINRYGENLVLNGGLRVTTSLDWEMQQIAEKVVAEGAERNEKLYQGKNAALVAEDPKTGQVLALVGSRDYFDVENEGNFNVPMQGLRQPGSALKPFAYLTAFQKGYSPKTVVFDVPTEFVANDPLCPGIPSFDTENKKCFHPQNFDEKFRGPVSFEEGLAQSINVPSVKVLYLAGLEDTLKTIHAFGVTTLNETWRYGLSLILGGGEVKLIDLINAYATLSQEGVRHKQSLVLKVVDGSGRILEDYHDETERVMDAAYPRLISQILSDKELRSSLFQNSLGLTFFPDRDVALKTGTTNDYRDAWAIGYTPSLVVGVWAGNNNNAPMQRHGSSILAAVPIWNAFLKEVLPKYPAETFERPSAIPLSSKPMLSGQYVFNPIIKNKTYPQIHSILYYVDPKNPLGPVPSLVTNPQFKNWEIGVINWARLTIFNFSEYNQPLSPEAFFESPDSLADISITDVSPTSGSFVNVPFVVRANIKSSRGLNKIELYFNRVLINSFAVSGNYYSYSYYLNNSLGPQNLIEIKATNTAGEENKASIIFFR